MKTISLKSFLIILMLVYVTSNAISQGSGWERVGYDNTPGDMRVPLCILEYNGYIFFGDDHVGIFRIKEPVTDTSNWVHLPIPGINIVYDLVSFDGALWCCSYGNGVFSSDDNGETWMDRNAGLTHHQVDALTVCNNMLFCGTYHGGIFRLDNGTGTWAAVNTGFSYPPNSWYALELQTIGQVVYLYTVGIGMWYTTNYGEGWYSLNYLNYDGNAEVHDFVDHGGYLMIPADYLGVMRSNMGGEAWDFCNEGMTSQQSVKSMAATDQAVFVGTSDSAVFISKDHGDHWYVANSNFPWSWQDNRYSCVYAMEVIGEYLYVGVWYEGMWRAKLSDLYAGNLGINGANEMDKTVLFQNQPNPFRQATLIRYHLYEAGQVTLKVYDASGNPVLCRSESRELPGEYSFTYRAFDGMSPGLYYYTLDTGSEIFTRKMVYMP